MALETSLVSVQKPNRFIWCLIHCHASKQCGSVPNKQYLPTDIGKKSHRKLAVSSPVEDVPTPTGQVKQYSNKASATLLKEYWCLFSPFHRKINDIWWQVFDYKIYRAGKIWVPRSGVYSTLITYPGTAVYGRFMESIIDMVLYGMSL